MNRFASAFYPKDCYAQVKANPDEFDDIYCTGNTLIFVASIINSVILSVMLTIHIKANMRSLTFVQLMTKVKTTMLILMLILQLSVLFRYGINFDNEGLYDFILIVSGFV